MRYRIGLAYLLLVGLPVILMVGTLRVGRRIAAPFSIGGSWAVTLDPVAQLDGCAGWRPDRRELIAEVSQSGTSVAITLNDSRKTVLNSTLSYRRIIGSSAPVRIAGCQDMRLVIDANVASEVMGRSLAGRFLLADCPGCGSIPFRASRSRLAGKE